MYKKLMLIALVSILSSLGSAISLGDSQALDRIHGKIESRFPNVQHIDGAALRSSLDQQDEDILLFDVREKSEYSVSHLSGAIRVDPDMDYDEFSQLFHDQIQGKKLVFYCAVGMRSSRLANRIEKGFKDAPVAQVYSLKNGIFGWHNNQHELVNASSATEFVHPYSNRMVDLIDRKPLVRFSVE